MKRLDPSLFSSACHKSRVLVPGPWCGFHNLGYKEEVTEARFLCTLTQSALSSGKRMRSFLFFLKFSSNFYEYSFSSYLQYFLQSKSKLFSKWWVLTKSRSVPVAEADSSPPCRAPAHVSLGGCSVQAEPHAEDTWQMREPPASVRGSQGPPWLCFRAS